MSNSRFYSSIAAVTNLQVTASPSDVSFQVASSSGWPGSFPFIVSLDYGAANEELVLVTSGGPNIFQATRAYDGTSASTHNAGAVVRHTSSAIDFTDSRTHEASTTGVHGISGSFVDTNSVQTLTNKTLTAPVINNPTVGGTASGGTYTGATLTSPVINSATLNGTVAGSPTFSGVPVFGGATFNSSVSLNAGLNVTGGATTLGRGLTSDAALNIKVTGDTNPRLTINADGDMSFGAGGVSSQDVTLQRIGAGFLGVTGSLTTSGSMTATGNLLGNDISLVTTTWTTFTPTWTNLGGATFSVNTGWYKKFGKHVEFVAYAAVSGNGSGSGGVQLTLPSTPFRDGAGVGTTRQSIPGFIGGVGGINFPNGIIFVPIFATDTGPATASIRSYAGDILQGSNLSAGNTAITVQGSYREA